MAVSNGGQEGEDSGGMSTRDAAIAGGVVGGVLLLILAVVIYACCVRCKKRKQPGRDSSSSEKQHSHQNMPDIQIETVDEIDGNATTRSLSSLNVDVPVPLNRRTSGYNNRNEDDLQPITHKITTGTLEAAMQSYNIDERRLRLDDIIGRGTYGLVYNGRLYERNQKDPTSKYQEVAVKTVHGPGCTPGLLTRFVEEGMMMRNFKHRHVLSLVGLVIRDDQPFVVYPSTPHGVLRNYIGSPKQQFTVKVLMEMGQQVAHGLRYLSEQGFVHRDIATRNCLVDREGQILVADSALSRDLFDEEYLMVEQLSDDPLPIGWMAVETLTQLTYSLQSDVWSYGVLLWELMTRGQAPYPSMEAATIIAFVRTGQRLQKPAVTPENLFEMMLACWKENPSDRPTISAICDKLESILYGAQKAKRADYKKFIKDSSITDFP